MRLFKQKYKIKNAMIINEKILGLIELKKINETRNVIEFIFGVEVFGQQNHFTLDDIIGYIYYFIKFYKREVEFSPNLSIPKDIVGKTIFIKFAFVKWMSSLNIGNKEPKKNRRNGKNFYNYSCKKILKQTNNKCSAPVKFDDTYRLFLYGINIVVPKEGKQF